ncbi:MAG: hypothetical protein ABIR60_08685 [Allosphingosinicella sp.]
MSDRKQQSRERIIKLTTPTAAPTTALGSTNTAPHIVLSATAGNGEITRGFSLALFAPDSGGAAVASSGGFDVTIYKLNTTMGVWCPFKTYTGPGAAYQDQLVCFDFGGGAALYFVLGNVLTNGNVLALVGELP